VSEKARLGLLFGAIYFLQGIGEPTEGLIAQPVRSMLKTWGHAASEIAAFSALLAIPWSLKPIYGLLSDFAPIRGSRRRSYLILAGGVMAVSLLGLFAWPVPSRARFALLAWLIGPTVAVAFADVVADALMVERGRPLGLTGRLQAIQWGSLSAASILTGLVGGLLAEHHRETWSFLICGLVGLATMALAWGCVVEPGRPPTNPEGSGREAIRALGQVARTPAVLAIGAFLFLWSFNPFSNDILNLHLTRQLHFREDFYGLTVAWISVGAIGGSLAYGAYCRRFSLRARTHASIVFGIAGTLAYLAVTDPLSAVIVSVVVGFASMTGLLIQFDLAAQVCPPRVAGTTFALLMALSNLGTSLSTGLALHGRLLADRAVPAPRGAPVGRALHAIPRPRRACNARHLPDRAEDGVHCTPYGEITERRRRFVVRRGIGCVRWRARRGRCGMRGSTGP
jgi:MFS family permease